MKIAILDADFIGRKKHRFPNLTCMKLSGYYKARGDDVFLKKSWDDLGEDADETFVAKVFSDTTFPADFSLICERDPTIHWDGTGFFFDQAGKLPPEIEHTMPDYSLYDGIPGRFYKDYSIGFLTRGCFRHCRFCVNQRSNRSIAWSPLREFMDEKRKKLCFLNDNFLACKDWERIIHEVIETGKPFRFHQGLDVRLLDEKKIKALFFDSVYDGDFTFAFDDIRDRKEIEEKMDLIRSYTDTPRIRFYVLCGFKGIGKTDIIEMLERIKIIGSHGMIPYIMRYQDRRPDIPGWRNSYYRHLYVAIARWVNQPSLFKSMSFSDFCEKDQISIKGEVECASLKSMHEFAEEMNDLAKIYFYEPLYKKA